jgi:CheY-like chemotaxis protein
LIQKGDVSKKDLLNLVAQMVSSQFKTITNRAIRRRHPIASNKPIVLVVEDNPDNLITLKALLKDSVTLIEASDGQSGIILSKEQKPDIILLDIALPDIDGFTVLAEIRKIESLQNIPVIALTARAMKGDPDEILSHGFDGYISKPIDSQRLTTILEEVLYGS